MGPDAGLDKFRSRRNQERGWPARQKREVLDPVSDPERLRIGAPDPLADVARQKKCLVQQRGREARAVEREDELKRLKTPASSRRLKRLRESTRADGCDPRGLVIPGERKVEKKDIGVG